MGSSASASDVKLKAIANDSPAETADKGRNPGMPLDKSWVNSLRMNLSAIEQRTATLPGRRSVKKDWQAAWLLKAITCIDLTTLSGDDTPGRVKRLCAKAKQPVRQDILEARHRR